MITRNHLFHTMGCYTLTLLLYLTVIYYAHLLVMLEFKQIPSSQLHMLLLLGFFFVSLVSTQQFQFAPTITGATGSLWVRNMAVDPSGRIGVSGTLVSNNPAFQNADGSQVIDTQTITSTGTWAVVYMPNGTYAMFLTP